MNPVAFSVDVPFHVVDGGGRVLGIDNVAYTDPDVDFDSAQLQYEWRDVGNGDVVLAHNRDVPVYLFSQRELADGLVYFRHRAGSGNANTTIWVSDGVHVVTAVLEVIASSAFIGAGNGTSLIVERGKRVALTPANLAGPYRLIPDMYVVFTEKCGYYSGIKHSMLVITKLSEAFQTFSVNVPSS